LFFQVSFVSVEEGRVEDKEGRGAGSWEQARTLQHAQASTAAGLAVTYRRSSKGWCTRRSMYPPDGSPAAIPRGLLYVKVPKSASSTLASIVHRIAIENECEDFRNEHTNEAQKYARRDKARSFLLGSVRDPANRAVSRVFWVGVTQKGLDPTDENVLDWLSHTTDHQYGAVSKGQGGFQTRYLDLREPGAKDWVYFTWEHKTRVRNPVALTGRVKAILRDYDFMVVVERMDESVVMLGLLLGIDVGDLLTVSSKVHDRYHYFPWLGKCLRIAPSFVSRKVGLYLNSSSWYAQNYGDYLLHEAASLSLDKSIEAWGRPKFDEALARYRKLKERVEEECLEKTVFQCTSEGVAQPEKAESNCYDRDRGCGYPCIDRTVLESARTWD